MKLEVCIDRLESALVAKAGGADRIEVCGALSIGGITPSAGLIEQCVAMGGIDVMMMVRPHGGSFCYEAADIQTMISDIRRAKQLGVQGIVLGALCSDGESIVSCAGGSATRPVLYRSRSIEPSI